MIFHCSDIDIAPDFLKALEEAARPCGRAIFEFRYLCHFTSQLLPYYFST